jgi:hypothetical protein
MATSRRSRLTSTRRAATVLLLALALAGCSSTQRYSDEVRNNFLRSCQASGGTPSGCAAALECVEGELSEAQFVEEEMRLMLGQPSDRIVSVMARCVR